MSKNTKSALKINKIQPTNEKITGHGGMSLFKRYSDMTGICDILAEIFGELRRSEKGVGVYNLCKQGESKGEVCLKSKKHSVIAREFIKSCSNIRLFC